MMRIRDARSGLKALKQTGPFLRWGMRSTASMLDAHISDPRLKAILTIQSGNHGVAPSRSPAATRIICSTRSSPVTISVTGCST